MIAKPSPERSSQPPRTPGLTAANIIFITAVFLVLVLSVVEAAIFPHNSNTVRSTLITELLGIVAPVLLLTLIRGYDWRATFSLKPLPFRLMWRAALLGFLAQFAVFFIAGFNQWLFDIYGPFPALFDPPTQILPAFAFFLLLSLLPAICEEMLNRGIVLAGYRQVGFARTVILVGVLFGLFHLYPSRFGYTAVLGAVLAYVVLLSGSIFASIITHFCFNMTSGLLYIVALAGNSAPEQKPYEYIDPISLLPQLGISVVGGALAYVVLRSFTTHAAQLRPGIVIGRFGLARDIVEDAEWVRPDAPPAEGQPTAAPSAVYSSQPTYTPMPTPQPGWQSSNRQSPARPKWFNISFAAVIGFWLVFGVAQEIYIRIYYKDPKNQKPAVTAPAPKSSAPTLAHAD